MCLTLVWYFPVMTTLSVNKKKSSNSQLNYLSPCTRSKKQCYHKCMLSECNHNEFCSYILLIHVAYANYTYVYAKHTVHKVMIVYHMQSICQAYKLCDIHTVCLAYLSKDTIGIAAFSLNLNAYPNIRHEMVAPIKAYIIIAPMLRKKNLCNREKYRIVNCQNKLYYLACIRNLNPFLLLLFYSSREGLSWVGNIEIIDI